MLQKFISSRSSLFKGRLEESKILFIYRYLSLLITSIFYFLNNSEHLIGKKIFIIGCLAISTVILSYLYIIFEKSSRNIKVLLLMEIIGNSVLLIPSGGIKSPFIWYTLNTILVSSIFLKKRYCLIILFLYILFSVLIGYFQTSSNFDITRLLKDEYNLILSFIMIIVAIQSWSVFVKKIKDKSVEIQKANIELKLLNKMIIESMDHTAALYESINILSNQGNKEGTIRLLFEHIKKITKTNFVFYYDVHKDNCVMTLNPISELARDIEEYIKVNLNSLLQHKEPLDLKIFDSRFKMVALKSNYGIYGILGLESTNNQDSMIYENNIYQLQFLSKLITIAFDRFYLEEINERLLITEEQNRIANEIHDSVLQRLFSMSCGVFSLIKRLDKCKIDEIEEELNLIRKTTDNVMKELRSKIYGLSWQKSGNNSFITDVKAYIEDIKRLNDINIPFSILGNDELLSCKQKKALYRIICEGIGNAVRHGKANKIEVNMEINPSYSQLTITDDGIGFDLQEIEKNKIKGLGIQNLYQLTESLGGNIIIDTKLGAGARIVIMLPNNVELMKGEKVTV